MEGTPKPAPTQPELIASAKEVDELGRQLPLKDRPDSLHRDRGASYTWGDSLSDGDGTHSEAITLGLRTSKHNRYEETQKNGENVDTTYRTSYERESNSQGEKDSEEAVIIRKDKDGKEVYRHKTTNPEIIEASRAMANSAMAEAIGVRRNEIEEKIAEQEFEKAA